MATTVIAGVESAAALVDQALNSDNAYCDLSEQLQVPRHNQPTVSGKSDVDYPSLADSKIKLSTLRDLSVPKKVPLPAELVEQFGHMQFNCLMGLFPDINRAWLSIDSDIFVWNFEDGSDVAYFDGMNEVIVCAGLVLPRAGVFRPHISHLLCLCTPVDIVLLGVSFTRPGDEARGDVTGRGDMHLLPEPLFSIPTDNTLFSSVQGTRDGRIFMAAKDGCLYELVYQAEDGWFSRKCRKINHSTSKLSVLMPSFLNLFYAGEDGLQQIAIDDSRHVLYTLSEKGTIQLFDLGADGRSISRVAAVSLHTTAQNAHLLAKGIDVSNFKPIVHISAIKRAESVHVHLVAVTRAGVRLYFCTRPFNDVTSRPYVLSLIHVRLPPGFSGSSLAPPKPSNIQLAHYSKGALLMVSALSEDNDTLWCVSSDTFPFRKQLMETQETSLLDGKTWAMAEMEVPAVQAIASSGDTTLPAEGATKPGIPARADPPTVVTQHMDPPRRFVLLNSNGSYLISKLTPVDQLRALLLAAQGTDSPEVAAFFALHKEDLACATCLVLACADRTQAEQQVAEWATRAFTLFGGEPHYKFQTSSAPTNIGPSIGSGFSPLSPISGQLGLSSLPPQTPASSIHPQHISTPMPAAFGHPAATQQTATSLQEVVFSGKHNGLVLYVSRVLRPLWESRLVSEFPHPSKQLLLTSTVRSEQLSWFLEQLVGIKDFMERNTKLSPYVADTLLGHNRTMSRHGDGPLDDVTKRRLQTEAAAAEKASLVNLQSLVTLTCEVLGLWKILCYHQLHVIINTLPRDTQNLLRQMTFRHLITAGKEMTAALIQALVNSYLSDDAATDAISNRLREICPSLYSAEDAVFSKASEMLKTVRTADPAVNTSQYLQEALQKYKAISTQLDLQSVCTQFAAVHFYSGVVDLALTAAGRRDPQNLALHHYRSGQPPEDTPGASALQIRLACYKCITDTMADLLSTSQSHPQAPSIPRSPGPPPAKDANRLTNQEAEKHSEDMFRLALKSDDEMFHVSLYDWLLSKDLTEKLLQIQSPYLEPFLQRAAGAPTDSQSQLNLLDLLWKYYQKSGNFGAASRILAKLADRRGPELTLAQRVEYLSRATMSAKSSTQRTSLATEGEFLHELEEKMEVARIQVQVHEALQRKANQPGVQAALEELNSGLCDITTLYGDFAERFALHDAKLAIVHAAGHYDTALVETLWHDVIERELHLTADAPVSTKMSMVGGKLVTLGRIYGGTDRYFPLGYLVQLLEKVSCEQHFDVKFVFTHMQDVGITLPRLHEVYDNLIKVKDSYWSRQRRPLHLVEVQAQLIGRFVDTPTSVPAYERRVFVTRCLDSLAAYLVELLASSSQDAGVLTLVTSLRRLQAQLERAEAGL